MSCEALLNRLGYSCSEVADGTILVTTPFAFADGELISFYLNEDQDQVSVHDNGDTLFHLAGTGWDISTRRKWSSIKNLVGPYGFDLLDSGTIIGKETKSHEQLLITKYVGALLSVADVERERLGLTEDQTQFVSEVEGYLRAANPTSTVDLSPVVGGHSGKSHQFNFSLDGKLVDALRPHGRSTGAELRKVLDVTNTGRDYTFLVVMDDREDPERAKAETDILSTVTAVMQFSDLCKIAPRSYLQH